MKFNINLPKFFSYESRAAKEKRLADEELFSRVEEHSKKYLEEFIDQLNSMDRSSIVSMPSFSTTQSFGRKELPLRCAVKEAYLINPTVYACVQAIAQSTAMACFTLHEKGKDGQYSTVFADPILDLLDCPNKTQTQQELITLIVIDLMLCGNALIYKNTGKAPGKYKPGQPVIELTLLNPDFIEYKDDGLEIVSYEGRVKTNLEGNKWNADQIIHFRLANPLNQFWGISPIQAGFKAVDVDSKILNWWLATMENGCKKDALIKFKHDLTETQFRRVRSLIEQQVAGFRNGRGYMILGHEAEMQFLDMAPAELDFVNSRKASEKSIISIFRVPPPMAGDMDNASYNNVDAMLESFWLDTIMPILQNICGVFTKRLLPDFGRDVKRFYIGFDPLAVQPLKQIYYKAWDCATKMVNIGVPLNTAIKKLDLQLAAIDGGDIGYMSHNLVPLGYYDNVSGPDTAPEVNNKTKPKDDAQSSPL